MFVDRVFIPGKPIQPCPVFASKADLPKWSPKNFISSLENIDGRALFTLSLGNFKEIF
jgi:hypothetical protein